MLLFQVCQVLVELVQVDRVNHVVTIVIARVVDLNAVLKQRLLEGILAQNCRVAPVDLLAQIQDVLIRDMLWYLKIQGVLLESFQPEALFLQQIGVQPRLFLNSLQQLILFISPLILRDIQEALCFRGRFLNVHKIDFNILLLHQFQPFIQSSPFVAILHQCFKCSSLGYQLNQIQFLRVLPRWVFDDIIYDLGAFFKVLAQSLPTFQLLSKRCNLCFQESIDIENFQSDLVQLLSLFHMLRFDIFNWFADTLTIVVNLGNQTLNTIELGIGFLDDSLYLCIFHFKYSLFKIFILGFHLIDLFFIFIDIIINVINLDKYLFLFLFRNLHSIQFEAEGILVQNLVLYSHIFSFDGGILFVYGFDLLQDRVKATLHLLLVKIWVFLVDVLLYELVAVTHGFHVYVGIHCYLV